ncbi:MAG: MlaD family protein [Gemmataceae bacterium]
MNEQTLRFRVGVFVLGTLLLLGVLITLFGGMPRLFKRQDIYYITFKDAAGVAPGTPVRRSGVRIGEVANVTLDNDTGEVLVEIRIDRQYKLRTSDQPVLVQSVLGGDSTIDFVPKSSGQSSLRRDRDEELFALAEESQPPEVEDPGFAKPGTKFIGRRQKAMQDVVDATTDVLPDAQGALKEIQKSLASFEKLKPQIEDAIKQYTELAKTARESIPELMKTNQEVLIAARNYGRLGERIDVLVRTNQDKVVKAIDNLNDAITRVSSVLSDENQKNLQKTLNNVQKGTENLESITKNTEAFVKEGRETLKRVTDSVNEANQVFENLNKATKPLGERSESIVRNFDEGSQQVNKLAAEMRELLRCLAREDGTLQLLMTDPSLYRNLNDVACMATRMMPRLDQILQNVEVFADKIARHPETLGVRGAVRPSSGIK